MADFPDSKQITDLLSLLAPGLIIATIRTRAISGSYPDYKDRLVAFGLISALYFAAVTPLFHADGGLALPPTLWRLLQYFILPVFVGLALAYEYQHRLTYRLAETAKLTLAHHLPAAWDYAFESLPAGTFVLVSLADGRTIPGKMTKNSFASSSKEERDLLLEELWAIDARGNWTRVDPPRSILICGKDIKLVEIF
jgi:Family of unknown function (DUF6338)